MIFQGQKSPCIPGRFTLRIAYQGCELLETGNITLPIPEPERGMLMEIRRGEVPPEVVLDRLRERSAQLEDTILNSALPESPDRDAVDGFLVDAYQRAWAGELTLAL